MMSKPLTYKKSGVDITKADRFVKAIQSSVKGTLNPAVLQKTKAFGSMYALNKRDVLVSSADGVGTKLLIAKLADKHNTVGMDLVAMNVNDILCVGAKPLFFLDYIACGKLDPDVLKDVVKGIATGCRQSGCALIGGETAEMPGMYAKGDYDLAGFALGVVEKNKIIDGSKIKKGDVVIGLPSSGIHSNGYSLVRKVFSLKEQKTRAKELLTPTKIYVKDILPLVEKFPIRGMAHVTGGAFYEKLTKILPKGLCFSIRKGSWPVPEIFKDIQSKGRVLEKDMYRTFNMGIGFTLIISPRYLKAICAFLKKKHIRFFIIGQVVKHSEKRIVFV